MVSSGQKSLSANQQSWRRVCRLHVCEELFDLELVSGRLVRDTALIKAVWKFRANLLITGRLIHFGWRWRQSCYLGAEGGGPQPILLQMFITVNYSSSHLIWIHSSLVQLSKNTWIQAAEFKLTNYYVIIGNYITLLF